MPPPRSGDVIQAPSATMSISPLLLVKQVTMSRLVVALKQSGQLPPHMVFQIPLLGCRPRSPSKVAPTPTTPELQAGEAIDVVLP